MMVRDGTVVRSINVVGGLSGRFTYSFNLDSGEFLFAQERTTEEKGSVDRVGATGIAEHFNLRFGPFIAQMRHFDSF